MSSNYLYFLIFSILIGILLIYTNNIFSLINTDGVRNKKNLISKDYRKTPIEKINRYFYLYS